MTGEVLPSPDESGPRFERLAQFAAKCTNCLVEGMIIRSNIMAEVLYPSSKPLPANEPAPHQPKTKLRESYLDVEHIRWLKKASDEELDLLGLLGQDPPRH